MEKDLKLWDGGLVYIVVFVRGFIWVGGFVSLFISLFFFRRIGKVGVISGEILWGVVWFLLSIISLILIFVRSKRFVFVVL